MNSRAPNLRVRQPVTGEPRHLRLLGGKVLARLDGAFARALAGRQQLPLGAPRETPRNPCSRTCRAPCAAARARPTAGARAAATRRTAGARVRARRARGARASRSIASRYSRSAASPALNSARERASIPGPSPCHSGVWCRRDAGARQQRERARRCGRPPRSAPPGPCCRWRYVSTGDEPIARRCRLIGRHAWALDVLAYGRSGKQKISRASSASSFRRPGTESSTEDFDIRTHALGTSFARIHAPTAGRRSLGSAAVRRHFDSENTKGQR
jgi:hypothetical protein